MKLMVGEVLEVLNGVQKILQHYRGSKVVDMLDDIYLRCCTSNELKSGGLAVADKVREAPGERNPVVKKAGKHKRELCTEEQFLLLKEELESLEREQAEAVLLPFKVKELCAFADWSSISVQKSGRKDVIVGQISNHFGFSHLNMKMGQRPDMVR